LPIGESDIASAERVRQMATDVAEIDHRPARVLTEQAPA
jgi:hypothetical protein